MRKARSPMQVSDAFKNRLKELQRKIRMTTGQDKSLRDLTDAMLNDEIFNDIEKKILGSKPLKDLSVKFDRRLI